MTAGQRPSGPAVETLAGDALVRRTQAGGPVVVLFVADWCGYCSSLLRELRERLGTDGPAVVLGDLSSYTDPNWERFEIDVVPTIVGFAGGRLVVRRDGTRGRGLHAAALDEVQAALAA